MGDLAQAMVSLARAAERRRGARATLVDATDTIAMAIREQLRSGDAVEVDRYQKPKTAEATPSGTSPATPETAEYEAVRVSYIKGGAGAGQDALARDLAIFGVSDSQILILRVTGWKDEWKPHIATMDERQAFVYEVDSVIKAFARNLTTQAATYEATVKKATKLVPR